MHGSESVKTRDRQRDRLAAAQDSRNILKDTGRQWCGDAGYRRELIRRS